MNHEEISQHAKDCYEKGLFAFNKENYDYAIELFTQVLAFKPDYVDAWHMLWLSLRKSLEKNPPSPLKRLSHNIRGWLPTLKGNFATSKGRYKEAIKEYQKVIFHTPLNTSILTKIANILLKQNLFDNATKIFEEIIQIDANNLFALKNLGRLYLNRKDYLKARAFYEKALKISPHDSEAERELKNLDALGTIEESFGTTP
jgi:tetratricopeptide (TPR) repeat protein